MERCSHRLGSRVRELALGLQPGVGTISRCDLDAGDESRSCRAAERNESRSRGAVLCRRPGLDSGLRPELGRAGEYGLDVTACPGWWWCAVRPQRGAADPGLERTRGWPSLPISARCGRAGARRTSISRSVSVSASGGRPRSDRCGPMSPGRSPTSASARRSRSFIWGLGGRSKSTHPTTITQMLDPQMLDPLRSRPLDRGHQSDCTPARRIGSSIQHRASAS